MGTWNHEKFTKPRSSRSELSAASKIRGGAKRKACLQNYKIVLQSEESYLLLQDQSHTQTPMGMRLLEDHSPLTLPKITFLEGSDHN